MSQMMQKFLDERSSIRVWTNYIPKGVSKYFVVRKLKKIGCENETCTHFSHDPSAPVYLLSPIWPVVAQSLTLTNETRELRFYDARDNEIVLVIEQDLTGRWWDKVFCPTE